MTDDMKLLKQLTIELVEASNLYYNGGNSPLTDAEFDIKLNQLKELEDKYNFIYCNSPTINVGAAPVLDGINTIEIQDKPMLSLDKVHTAKEIEKFSDGYDLIASIKCDGLSVRLIYKNGELVSANTRGNGTVGSDITEHIKYFTNVPRMIEKIGTYIIDGEAIIYDKDFEIINKNGEFKNNRNTASGSLALLDMSIVKNRRLSFIAWDIIKGGYSKEVHYNFEEAEEFGFTVVPAFVLDCTKVEEEEIDNINKDLLNIAKEKGIPCDGVVWKINNIAAGDAKGRTAHHWCNAIAWKPAIEEYETELLNIEWSMGRTGVLTPIAIFKPVEIDGTIIERASLHNVSVMREVLGNYPDLYEKIWVYKANMIIPQISRAEKNNVPHDHCLPSGILTHCPYCGMEVTIEESDSGVLNAVCVNPLCDGKLVNRLDHFLGKKGLDVKGISKMTLGKLIDWGWINGLADIFKLDRYRAEWISKEGFGEVSVGKILSAITSTTNSTKVEQFISALGIPLVGVSVAKEIVYYFPTWKEFRDAVGGDWTEFEGFGPEISKAINSFDYTEADEIAKMLIFEEECAKAESTKNVSGLTFVITGKLQTGSRDVVKDMIEKAGGKVTGSVSAKTNYLVANAKENTAKYNKALELNIPIINEDTLLSMLK